MKSNNEKKRSGILAEIRNLEERLKTRRDRLTDVEVKIYNAQSRMKMANYRMREAESQVARLNSEVKVLTQIAENWSARIYAGGNPMEEFAIIGRACEASSMAAMERLGLNRVVGRA